MEKDSEEDNQEFEAFANNNGFVGYFRTSAKEGKNINEALNYLISNIITKRFPEKENKQTNILTKIKEFFEKLKNNEKNNNDKTKDQI